MEEASLWSSGGGIGVSGGSQVSEKALTMSPPKEFREIRYPSPSMLLVIVTGTNRNPASAARSSPPCVCICDFAGDRHLRGIRVDDGSLPTKASPSMLADEYTC